MRKFKPAWFQSPIRLEEGTAGQVAIRYRKYPAGSQLPVVGMRQAFLTGQRPLMACLPEPLVVHELSQEGHGVWMTDLPEELNQAAAAIYYTRPSGSVLVGGLGLGILPAFLGGGVTGTEAVDDVTVVEINADVAALADDGLRYGYRVEQADVAAYLLECDRYDTFMLDTWQATSEAEWWEVVMPLLRTIRNRFGMRPRVWCWAGDIMAGQVGRALQQGKDHWYYSGLPAMSPQDARAFIRTVGSAAWERRYGDAVDANLSRHARNLEEVL